MYFKQCFIIIILIILSGCTIHIQQPTSESTLIIGEKISSEQTVEQKPTITLETTKSEHITDLPLKLISKDDISELFNMSKDEILFKYGNDFEETPDYYDSNKYRYHYEDLGFSFLFQVGNEYPRAISCSEMINFQMVSPGMTFEEIKKQLGETSVTIIPVHGSDENYYQLKYNYGEFYIVFESTESDGSRSSMTFYINE